MGPKKAGSCNSNAFAALSLHEEQDPRKVLQLQSSRNKKKLQHQSTKPQGTSAKKQQQQQQQRQPASSSGSSSHLPSLQTGFGAALGSMGSGGPGSPGLQEALAAIAAAEQQEAASLWPQSYSAAAAAAAPAAASPSVQSLSTQGSAEASGWPSLLDLQDAGSDPWASSTPHQQQQQQQQPWGSSRHSARSCSPSPPQHSAQRQQERVGDGDGAGSLFQGAHLTSSQAFNWRCFAMSFAEAARAAGDEDAADGALMFSASEPLAAAVFAAAEGAAGVELEGVALQAAVAGLTAQELLQAQQEELLLQISRSRQRKAGPAWRKAALDWGSGGSSTGGLSSGHSSSCTSPVPKPKCAPDVGCDVAFPQLESSSSSAARDWQQAGRSPHAVPRGWKGGRQASAKAAAAKAPAKGIKLLHSPAVTAAGGDSSQAPKLRPSTLDLHWGLRLDGLAPLQRDSDEELGSPGLLGACGGSHSSNQGVVRGLSCDGQAAARTRQLLSEQEQAAAAAAAAAGSRVGAGSNSSNSNRDRLAADTMRNMMEKAASKDARLVAAAGSTDSSRQAAAAAVLEEPDEDSMGGSKASFSYSWSNVFKTALAAGWEPVGKADGGGGSHFKLRRLLPLSGVTQTMVLPCTPSDSQRGVRNVASSFKKREEEKVLLEAQAAAALQQAARGAGAKAGAGQRKK